MLKNNPLTFENAIPGEKLRVVRPTGNILSLDQIVTLIMVVKNVKTHRGVQSGAIINRGEQIEDFDSYIVWDLDRFVKFP